MVFIASATASLFLIIFRASLAIREAFESDRANITVLTWKRRCMHGRCRTSPRWSDRHWVLPRNVTRCDTGPTVTGANFATISILGPIMSVWVLAYETWTDRNCEVLSSKKTRCAGSLCMYVTRNERLLRNTDFCIWVLRDGRLNQKSQTNPGLTLEPGSRDVASCESRRRFTRNTLLINAMRHVLK